MKGIKKLSILGLSALFAVSIASCSMRPSSIELKDKQQEAYDEDYPEAYENDLGNKTLILSSILLETNEAKTTFYLNDVFSTEGLKVKVTFFEYTNGKRTGTRSEYTTNYSVNSDAFNSNAVGKYDIVVAFRYGASTRESKYTVEVKSSVIESTTNITYLAGAKVKFNPNAVTATVSPHGELLEDNFVHSLFIRDNYTFALNQLEISYITKTVDNAGNVTVEEKKVTGRNMANALAAAGGTLEENFDINKKGIYPIKITFTGEPLVINGVTYENKATSFVLIEVKNPATAVEKTSTGDTTFTAQINDFDLSNWRFKITRVDGNGNEYGSEENVPYDPEIMSVTGISQYRSGTQTAKIILAEKNGSQFIETNFEITVNASEKYNIILGNDASYKDDEENPLYWTEDTKVHVGSDVNGGKLYRLTDDSSDYEPFYASQAVASVKKEKIASYGALTFPNYHAVSANEDYMEVRLDKAGMLAIFASTTGKIGSGSREFFIWKVGTDGKETLVDLDQPLMVDDNPDQPVRSIASLEEGTYRIRRGSDGGIYIWGLVLAMEK
jgi:hypothetical protein